MKNSITRTIYLKKLSIMKKILDLAEFKLTPKEFKFFKQQLMDITYNGLKELFLSLECEKRIKRCDCGANLRQGYSDCPKCGGSGYKEIEKDVE